jgi:hypothetical protein
MEGSSNDGSAAEDWRLQAELDVEDASGALHGLLGRLRGGPDVVKDVESSVPHDVVVTHDGSLLFAYAAEEATIVAAREAIAGVLLRDGITAQLRVSRWDEERNRWQQTDPPPTADERAADDAAQRADDAIETRTLVVSSGKMIRDEFEQSLRAWAAKLDLECEIIEHPHMLTTQLAFTVTGPKRKVDEFSQGLAAEERQTIRAETTVMMSPL